MSIGSDNLQALKPEEVGERLRVSARTVYRLIKAGRLHYVLVGSKIRVPAAALRDSLGDEDGGRS
jgi:excisionase family DNA binding protein